jgi:hypothetical protein
MVVTGERGGSGTGAGPVLRRSPGYGYGNGYGYGYGLHYKILAGIL